MAFTPTPIAWNTLPRSVFRSETRTPRRTRRSISPSGRRRTRCRPRYSPAWRLRRRRLPGTLCRDRSSDRKSDPPADPAARFPHRAEDELAAGLGIAQHGVYADADCLEHFAEIGLQHQHREDDLQAQTPGHDARFDGALVIGEQPSYTENGHQPEQTGEAAHFYPTTSSINSRSSGRCAEMWKASRSEERRVGEERRSGRS